MFSTLMLILFVALQVGDVLTTNKALATGAKEANPIVKWLMDKIGDKWWVIKIPIIAIMFGVIYTPAWVILIPINILYIWVVWNNYKVGRK